MRAILLVALAACAEPTGLAQSWPPPRGITIEAVAAADLDADGATDVLVYASGDMHEAGIYRIEGSSDVDTSGVHAFTTYTPLALGHPSAGAIATVGGMPTVLAAFVGTQIDVDALDAQLATPDETLTDLPPGNAVLWVRTLAFPGNEQRIVVSNGTAIEHDSFTTIDPQSLPPPDGQAWAGATVATAFMSGSNHELAVATPTHVFTATVTSTDTSRATWTTLRDGPPWVGQVAVDLGGPHEYIVGLDLAAHTLCAIDPDGGAPLCLGLASLTSSAEVGIALVREASGVALAITQADATQTNITLLEHIPVPTTGLAGSPSAPAPVAIPHGRPVVVSRFVGADPSVLVFGPSGSVACGAGC